MGEAAPAANSSVRRLWAASRAVYTVPERYTVSPARKGFKSAAVTGAVR